MRTLHVITPHRGYEPSEAYLETTRLLREAERVQFHLVFDDVPVEPEVAALGLVNPTDAIILSKYRQALSRISGGSILFLDDDIAIESMGREKLPDYIFQRTKSFGVLAIPVKRGVAYDLRYSTEDYSLPKSPPQGMRAVYKWCRSAFVATQAAAAALTSIENIRANYTYDGLTELDTIMAKILWDKSEGAVAIPWLKAKEVENG